MVYSYSGGSFGSQSAKEFCFTIYSASIRISVAKYVALFVLFK